VTAKWTGKQVMEIAMVMQTFAISTGERKSAPAFVFSRAAVGGFFERNFFCLFALKLQDVYQISSCFEIIYNLRNPSSRLMRIPYSGAIRIQPKHILGKWIKAM
jgi:hypothetical protein